MAQVFISFVHEEERYAQAVQYFLREALPESKLDVFTASDRWAIYAGEKWLDRIFEELQAAKIVILILSEKSVVRPWVNFEAGAAWLKGAVVIPVCIGKMTKDTLPKPYSSLQAVELQNKDDQYYLLSSTCHHLGLRPPLPEDLVEFMLERDREEGKEENEKLKSYLNAYEHLRYSLKSELQRILEYKAPDS